MLALVTIYYAMEEIKIAMPGAVYMNDAVDDCVTGFRKYEFDDACDRVCEHSFLIHRA